MTDRISGPKGATTPLPQISRSAEAPVAKAAVEVGETFEKVAPGRLAELLGERKPIADAASAPPNAQGVDVGAVTSKWIGETEKNLGAVLADAERAGAELYFDEADALFGKRTKVADAHDRYANQEVGYLGEGSDAPDAGAAAATTRPPADDD